MGHALKNKIKGVQIKIAPLDLQAELEHEKDMDPKELMEHEKGESPEKEKQEASADKMKADESDDMAPSVDDHGSGDAHSPVDEHTLLKHMSGNGNLGRKPMSLGERAKDKMKERMAAIEKSKKGY